MLLLYVFGASVLVLLGHYLLFHVRLFFYKKPQLPRFSEPISVVICARNELQNLRRNLPLVLCQKNANFEVIVVNHQSEDGTAAFLHRMQQQYPNFRAYNFEYKEGTGKKPALSYGISKAKAEHLVLTDADCRPVSENWLAEMSSRFNQGDIVLGYSSYQNQKGWLHKIIAWDTLLTAQNYFGMALAGEPYMGVGRNLAYTKSLFKKAQGFSAHQHVSSGDDDLFIASVANSKNTVVCLSAEAFTISKPPQSWASWWRQKRRHLSVVSHYPKGVASWLGVFGLAQLLFYALLPMAIVAVFSNPFWWWVIGLKLGVQALILLKTTSLLKEKTVLWYFPLAELCLCLSLTIIHFQNAFSGAPKKWN